MIEHKHAQSQEYKRNQQVRELANGGAESRMVRHPKRREAPQPCHYSECQTKEWDHPVRMNRHDRRPDTERITAITNRRSCNREYLSQRVAVPLGKRGGGLVDAGFAPPKFPQLHESEDDRGEACESDISCRNHYSQQRHSGAQTEKNCDPNELAGGHVANADPRVRIEGGQNDNIVHIRGRVDHSRQTNDVQEVADGFDL